MGEGTEWECQGCGKRYPKHATPCSQCGSMSFEQVEFEPDPEPDGSTFTRRGLLLTGAGTTLGVVGVAGAASELTGVTDLTPIGNQGPDLEQSPVILDASLAEDYSEDGTESVSSVAVDSLEAGAQVWIVFALGYTLHGKRIHAETTVEIEGPDGVTLGSRVGTVEGRYDRTGNVRYVQGVPFVTNGFQPGTYTAELTARDMLSGDESPTETTTFELV